MTKRKPLPAILPGPDGSMCYLSRISFDSICGFFVSSGWHGFRGPLKTTRRAAILAWNRVMRVYHAAKKGKTK